MHSASRLPTHAPWFKRIAGDLSQRRTFRPGFSTAGRLAVILCVLAFHVARPELIQQAYFKASNTESLDTFGLAVAIDGDTAVVGAPSERSGSAGVNGNQADNSLEFAGAAYVFVRSGDTWTQQAYLKASNPGAGDGFGTAVAISGDTIVIGAPGEASNATGINGNQANNSLAGAGAAYVFVRNGSTWTQQAYLKASNTGADGFGTAVAVSGDTVVVGAPAEESGSTSVNGNQADNSVFGAGAAYVFFRSSGAWTQQSYLKPSAVDVSDRFGSAVAVDGNTVAVGVRYEDGSAVGVGGDVNDDNTIDSGAVVVFHRTGSLWTQQAYIKASNTDSEDHFGAAVALEGNTLIVGAPFEDSASTGVDGNEGDDTGTDSGAAYVFFRTGNTWAQQAYLKSDQYIFSVAFGLTVDVAGDFAVVGLSRFEQVHLFERAGEAWSYEGWTHPNNSGSIGLFGDQFGTAVAISGDTFFATSPYEDSAATGVGGNGEDNTAQASGAAYAFIIRPDLPEITVIDFGPRELFDGGQASGFDVIYPGMSGPRTFTIRNTGNAPLTGIGVTKSGPNAGEFILDTAGLGTELAPGGEATFIVAFEPATAGDKLATIHIASDDADENPFDFQVIGIGGTIGGPELRIERPAGTSLVSGVGTTDFGEVLLGAGRDRLFFVRNTGDTPLNVSSVSVTGSAGFYLLEPDNFSVFPGESVLFHVRYAPVSAVPANATITLFSDDADESSFVLNVTGAGVTPTALAQQGYLKASNTDVEDYFGRAIAVSGDTLVVGAPFEASDANSSAGNQADDSALGAGAAYVFVRDGNAWSQQAYLKAANSDADDWFGSAVAIDGDTVVIGAPREASAASTINGNAADNSTPMTGAAYVFVRSGGVWTQQAYLKAANSGEGDSFGSSVAIAGDSIVVGARYESSNARGVNGDGANEDSPFSGAAYVYLRSGVNWSQQAYLKASNTDSGDEFGRAVAIDGDTVVVGATGESSSAAGINGDQSDNTFYAAGAAYVFVRSGPDWSQQAYLKASRPESSVQFGASVAVSGHTVVVGAPQEASGSTEINGDETDLSAYSSGAAYVFNRTGISWSQQAYLKAPNTGAGDTFGTVVGISGDTVVAGAPQEYSNATGPNGNALDDSIPSAGAAYVFGRSAGEWSQQAYLKASNTGGGDLFGTAIAIDGGTIVVGAEFEASAATGVGGNQSDDSALGAGAVYVFTFATGTPPLVNLAIQRNGNQIVLTWPKTSPAYSVDASPTVPAAWGPAGGTPVENGNTMTLQLPVGAADRFFRLRWP